MDFCIIRDHVGIFTKIEAAVKHYMETGLGEDYAK